MKLHAGTNVIEKSGNFEESKFSIEASSKAFFILSDGLYSNKILAVVRELSTNAYDSHVDAGKANVPFDVHLPTALNPVFFIRDYGTSMDHDNCMQLYTTYFRSTRNNSNDAVGCLGLGSKAPFAYADSFTVEAYLDGTKRIYNAYKNEDGSPVFSLMHETETDEPNGIKVSIQVNSNDVHGFCQEASKVYEYFKVRPNFVSEKLTFSNPAKVLAGDNWYFDDNGDENLVIMGQIAYPLDQYQFADSGQDNKEYNFIRQSDGLRIFVNIGDVDITPSRESLSYSKETKRNIRSVLNKIMNEIAKKIEDQIKSQPTLYKARMMYVQISDQCASIKHSVESLQKSLAWNDQKLFDNIVSESINIKDKISLTHMHKSYYRKKMNTTNDIDQLHFKTNMKVIVDNLTRGGIGRIKRSFTDGGYGERNAYIYKLRDGETVDNCALYDILGGATKTDVSFTSDMPKVTYNRSYGVGDDSGPVVQAKVYNEETECFEDCNMSVKYENAHYFVESKGEVTLGSRSVDINYIENMIKLLSKKYPNEFDGVTFYAVKPSVAKNRDLANRSNWFDAVNILRDVINMAIEDHKQDIIDCSHYCRLSEENNHRFVDIFKKTKTNNEVKQIIAEYNEYEKRIHSIKSEIDSIHAFSKYIPMAKTVSFSGLNIKTDVFSKRFDAAIKKYPMLKLISGWTMNPAHEKIVSEYIDTIECADNMSSVLSSM